MMRPAEQEERAGLVQAAQQGDRLAIVALLTASQPDIRRYAQRSCHAADVDDAVQGALWSVHRRVGSLRAVGAFASWVFQIVIRECRRLERMRWAQSPIDDVLDDLRFATRPISDLRLDVARAIESLPSHYRAVILLRDLQDLTIGEIATALDLTREAVKGRLHRARHLVGEYLKD